MAGLNEALWAKAVQAKLLRTARLRADATVVPANVAYPTDSAQSQNFARSPRRGTCPRVPPAHQVANRLRRAVLAECPNRPASSSSPTSPPVPSRTGPNPDQASAGEAYCLVHGREIHVNSVCLALGRDRPSVSQIFHVGGHALEW